MDKHLHIVAFDVPWPADYGGVIDVYHKLRWMANFGLKINLHCFEYGRKPAKELKAICSQVHYYHRHAGKGHLLSRLPFIVSTRTSEELLNRLLKDDYPILFEGLHSCAYLNHPALKNRHKVVRTHNIEHHYYEALSKAENNLFKRYYFKAEAAKLEKFESQLRHAQAIAAISAPDLAHLSKFHGAVAQVSAFHPNDAVTTTPGTGTFCLYHGSLDVAENNMAALFLIEKVFSGLKIPLVIAGNRPSDQLREAANKHRNISIRDNVNTAEIHQLIADAQVNVLPTFQATGIKLKLLAALHMGRHCVVNGPMVEGTGLEPFCRVENTEKRMRAAIQDLFETPFSQSEIEKRKQLTIGPFANSTNAQRLVNLFFG